MTEDTYEFVENVYGSTWSTYPYFTLPIHAHFRAAAFHSCSASGKWVVDKMVTELSDRMIRSEVVIDGNRPSGARQHREQLLFQLKNGVFAFYRAGRLDVYAATPNLARRHLDNLVSLYVQPRPRTDGAEYFIVVQDYNRIHVRAVRLPHSLWLNETDLALHYGSDFAHWEAAFVELLKTQERGLSLLRGEPGTGKTTFLQHLMSRLRKTHRFYFQAISHGPLIGTAEALSFWAEQNREHPEKKKVVVLEDAEEWLERRHPGNRREMSNLLNLSDGLMGEFLRMQVICTVNCPLDELDPAVRRRGRLLACREFRRLTRPEAQRLAGSKGFQLPEQRDYSLAEIFRAGTGLVDEGRTRRIGFGIQSEQ
jgi:hypothetical protein